jgi:putative inorganic carbon (hco3(-)) transporter
MKASAAELLGLLTACGGAALALVARDPRLRYAAMAVSLLACPALVAGDVWEQPRFEDLRETPALVALAVALLAAGVAAVAAVFHRYAWAFPVAALAVLPLRLPVQVGGETSHLLIPLYLVVAAAVASGAYSALRQADATADPALVRSRLARSLVWVVAAALVLYALQAAYSKDVSNAIENAAFFLAPFGVLMALLLGVDWTPRLLGIALAVVGGMTVAFAAVALLEYASRDLLLNKDLRDANQLHLYFRVNSLFFDPNVFGRYMALAILALAAYVGWSRDRRGLVLATLAAAVSIAALALSFSITSFAALGAGMLLLVALRRGWKGALAGASLVVLAAGALAIGGGPGGDGFGSDGRELGRTTSGRVDLVSGGIDLALERPLAGWGSGSFGAAFASEIERARTTTSHSEPITVAAEQGLLGMAVYVALVVLALIVLLPGAGGAPARAALVACFVAMLVHSLGYAGFIIDPATWALLGIGIPLAQRRDR